MYIVLPKGKDIIDVIPGEPGPKSDISQFREAQSKFGPKQRFRGDTGYQGKANIATPHKCLSKINHIVFTKSFEDLIDISP